MGGRGGSLDSRIGLKVTKFLVMVDEHLFVYNFFLSFKFSDICLFFK